jgi:two-component sensor histidine kinase
MLRENEWLFSCIHHRVKNNLRVVSSLLNLQAGQLADPAARHVFESQRSTGEIRIAFRGREQAYSLSVDDSGVPLPADLLTRDSRSMCLRLVRVLTRQLDGELRAGRPGRPKFEIVFPREARRE